MNTMTIPAIVLVVAGILRLAYGSFSLRTEHDVRVGPIEMSVQDKQTVNVPVWAGVGAIVIGGALLMLGARKPNLSLDRNGHTTREAHNA